MVLAKSKNSAGLGNSLMNDRFGKGKASNMKKASHNAAIVRQDPDGNSYVTNAPKQAAWMKMRSVTEQQALDEFLSTAELANTDFTAEKMHNVKIIHSDQKNPYLLSATEEQSAIRKQSKNRNRLTVPRRPAWDATTTREELDRRERANLLEWRRGLAELQENNDLLMTPFERNIEVWRQLWRVIERSDLVVQIVDARNPLLFRCDDLETYVRQIDSKKRNLLLINKADMLTDKQRVMWAEYFEREQIDFRFFSAHLAKERNERLERGETEEDTEQAEEELAGATDSMNLQDGKRRNIEILDVEELEELFLSNAPDKLPESDNPEHPRKQKTTIGLVGYPNVGKSSTINALLGSKKVSVSATPGKTKHFQTLYLTPEIMLCDCPGLVFPNFASTKAELVVNGVLPIDQQREFTGPAHLVAQRIPKTFLENIYGMRIRTRPLEEGGTGVPTSHELLRAYARARGFSTQGLGQPDESRAARYVLKDYVNGKLLYCHPPPQVADADPIDPAAFNHELYDIAHLPPRRQAALLKTMEAEAEANAAAATRNPTSAGGDDDESQEAAADIDAELLSSVAPEKPGLRSRNLDTGFFGPGTGTSTGRMTLPFNAQYTTQGQEMRKPLTGRKERLMVAMDRGIDPSEVRKTNSKKHFKANKRQAKKTRKAGEEDDY